MDDFTNYTQDYGDILTGDTSISSCYVNKGKVKKIKKSKTEVVHIRSIALFSSLAFILGIAVSFSGLYIASKVNIPRGIGGLETATEPQFDENDLDSLSGNKTSKENSALPISLGENSMEEDIDSARQLLTDEVDNAKTSIEKEEELPLCYYTYRVKKGDIIGNIAEKFNITTDTIISVNDIHQSRLLQIGQYLKIPSMAGIAYTVRKDNETIKDICDKFEISAKKCSEINNLDPSDKLTAGRSLFLPDAQLDWATKQEINGDLFIKPIKTKYYLSSYYGWRASPFSGKRSYHSGIDMACPQGTPIYASLAGEVTSTGFNNVYGNFVIVTHHSGYKTLYGHMSAILVAKGNHVYNNTVIGKVGSTGMSTGPHLHFTVYKFGKTVNPLGLLK